MELSKRLRAVAGLVTEGASVADIGTDHGYIPIYLVSQGIAEKVIASDINEGPLERARVHISEYKDTDGRIETRRSDGLKAIKPGEVDTMIAAGMGGGLIIKILEEGKGVTAQMDTLILQPQSEIKKVRSYLNSHGFRTAQEDMVKEDGKYYPMMKAVHGEERCYTDAELLYGRLLLEQRHPVLKEYLMREMRIRNDIAGRLRESAGRRQEERAAEIERELLLIREALGRYDDGK